MTGEKPLNVRVAEALGCEPKWETYDRPQWVCPCRDAAHRSIAEGACGALAEYGEDTPEGWAATGPLMSKYKLAVWERAREHRDGPGEPVIILPEEWYATVYDRSAGAAGANPIEAVANLIIALAEAWRLPR